MEKQCKQNADSKAKEILNIANIDNTLQKGRSWGGYIYIYRYKCMCVCLKYILTYF